jgi:CheY-like chemotaxis protein
MMLMIDQISPRATVSAQAKFAPHFVADVATNFHHVFCKPLQQHQKTMMQLTLGHDTMSESGLGCTFRCCFVRMERWAICGTENAHIGGSMQILIVDDHPDVGRALVRLLGRLGYEAEYLPSGADALRAMDQSKPRLVLLDLMMPDIDGMEVLRTIRRNPAVKDTPVVMFSASADPRHINEALSEGANDYWLKGFSRVEMLDQQIKRYVS